MKHKALRKFKARWARVTAFEEEASHKLSVTQKFWQLSSLVGMAVGLGVTLKEDKEKIETRARWSLLKNTQNGKLA